MKKSRSNIITKKIFFVLSVYCIAKYLDENVAKLHTPLTKKLIYCLPFSLLQAKILPYYKQRIDNTINIMSNVFYNKLNYTVSKIYPVGNKTQYYIDVLPFCTQYDSKFLNHYYYSIPYHEEAIVMLQQKNIKTIDKKNLVIVLLGEEGLKNYAKSQFSHANLFCVLDPSQLLSNYTVQNGTVIIFMTLSLFELLQANLVHYYDYKIMSEKLKFHIGVTERHYALIPFINKAIYLIQHPEQNKAEEYLPDLIYCGI